MKRTFEGFLKSYCAELAGEKTASLRKLCHHAATDAPRVAEPLFLLALEQGKLPYLLKLSKGTALEAPYSDLAKTARKFKSAVRFLEKTDAPARYQSVLEAFHAQKDAQEADRRINALMREKTVKALEAAETTRYRLCEDLKLNKGNVYAYLAGDPTKVSRDTARKIMEYALAL